MLQISDAVRGQFDGILRALPKIRDALRGKADVVAVRPGYDHGDGREVAPAVVVAVMPGTIPVQKSPLEQQFNVPFVVTEASVDEQLAAQDDGVAFEPGDGVGPFECLLSDDEAATFAPPKTGSYEELPPPAFASPRREDVRNGLRKPGSRLG